MTVIYRYMVLVTMCLFVIGTSGCNTFKGMGQDIEEAGEAIDETAEDIEDDMED